MLRESPSSARGSEDSARDDSEDGRGPSGEADAEAEAGAGAGIGAGATGPKTVENRHESGRESQPAAVHDEDGRRIDAAGRDVVGDASRDVAAEGRDGSGAQSRDIGRVQSADGDGTEGADAAGAVGAASAPFDGDWPALAERLTVGGLAQQVLLQSELLEFDARSFRIRVPIRQLADAGVVAKVREALSAHVGAPVVLNVDVGPVTGPTASSVAQQRQAERLARARDAIDDDPFVQSLIADFGARVLPESIRPIDRG